VPTRVSSGSVSGSNFSTSQWSEQSEWVSADGGSLEQSSNFDELSAEIIESVEEYLKHCGGQRSLADQINECWNYMSVAYPKLGMSNSLAANSMIPENGAVWRELVSLELY
jgi:hypothetical protein